MEKRIVGRGCKDLVEEKLPSFRRAGRAGKWGKEIMQCTSVQQRGIRNISKRKVHRQGRSPETDNDNHDIDNFNSRSQKMDECKLQCLQRQRTLRAEIEIAWERLFGRGEGTDLGLIVAFVAVGRITNGCCHACSVVCHALILHVLPHFFHCLSRCVNGCGRRTVGLISVSAALTSNNTALSECT